MKRKKVSKVVAVALAAVMVLSILPFAAFADTTTQDGIEVTLTTDKEEYESDENITATLTVTNTNDYAVNDVSLENLVPESYTVEDEAGLKEQLETLAAGESVSATAVYVPTVEETPASVATNSTTSSAASSSNVNTGSAKKSTVTVEAEEDEDEEIEDNEEASETAVKRNESLVSPSTGADEDDTETADVNIINVQTTVSVGDDTLNIEGVVTYSSFENTENTDEDQEDDQYIGEPYIGTLKSEDEYVSADIDQKVVFTITAEYLAENIKLYNDDNEIGVMHDDGLNGDEEANDGTYTYVVTFLADSTIVGMKEVSYYAQSGDLTSNSVTLTIYPATTEETQSVIDSVEERIHEIESAYTNENGYVAYDDVQTLIGEIADYISALYEDGTIYWYEVNDSNIMLQFSNGELVMYAPAVEGLLAGSNSDISMTVVGFVQSSELSEEIITTSANNIVNTFSNYTYSGTNHTNHVYIDDIKSITSNQIVLWNGHGEFSETYHSVLATSGLYKENEYKTDNINGRIIEDWTTQGSSHLALITYKFINSYCKHLDNDLIYFTSCYSGKDSVLANSFLNNGAAAVVGSSNEIYREYGESMLQMIITLMTWINPSTGNYYTLGEALEAAKAQLGENDLSGGIFSNIINWITKGPAEVVTFGYNDYRFSDVNTGTLAGMICETEDGTTPVSDANIEIYQDNELVKSVKSDSSGQFSVDLPAGKYKVKASANGHITFTGYETIEADTTTNMEIVLMIEESEQYIYLEELNIADSDRYTGNEGDSFINKLGTRNGKTDIYGNEMEHGLECWIARWNYTDEISWAWAEYDLKGVCSKLTGKITIVSDCYNPSSFNSTIEIIGDGQILYTNVLTPNMGVLNVSVDLEGVNTLKIYVYDNEAHSGGTSFALWDFAVYGNISELLSYDMLEFNGHKYLLFPNDTCATWEEAKQYCEDLGGHLATISDREENDALYDYIIGCGSESAYFGYYKDESTGKWKWVNNEKISYTNWASGEPNNERGIENYGMFYWKYTYTWNDGDFYAGTVSGGSAFICEWDS